MPGGAKNIVGRSKRKSYEEEYEFHESDSDVSIDSNALDVSDDSLLSVHSEDEDTEDSQSDSESKNSQNSTLKSTSKKNQNSSKINVLPKSTSSSKKTQTKIAAKKTSPSKKRDRATDGSEVEEVAPPLKKPKTSDDEHDNSSKSNESLDQTVLVPGTESRHEAKKSGSTPVNSNTPAAAESIHSSGGENKKPTKLSTSKKTSTKPQLSKAPKLASGIKSINGQRAFKPPRPASAVSDGSST